MAAGAVEVNVTTNNFKPCAVFDGVDDYVEVAHNANQLGANLADGFTLSAWILPRSAGEIAGKILCKGDDNAGGKGFYIDVINNTMRGNIDGGTAKSSAADSITYGIWTHVLTTFAADATITHYINNSQSGTPASPAKVIADIIATTGVRVGNSAAGTDRTFDGSISKAKMWNRVLTADEIALDYAGSPVNDGLILDVPLDEQDPAGNYTDNKGNAVTNSGSYASIRDDTIAAAIKADRTTANDKYLMVGMPGGQVVSAVIEEAP